jgi:cytochrome c
MDQMADAPAPQTGKELQESTRGVPMRVLPMTIAALFASATLPAVAADDAEALMKKSGCFTCHSLDKKKDGPSFKEVAARYKGKPDAEQKLFTHLTTHPKVKVDGKEEAHESLKTTNDAEVKSVVKWILAR